MNWVTSLSLFTFKWTEKDDYNLLSFFIWDTADF